MGADADSRPDTFSHRGVHDVRVPCVEAAGDVGAGHDLQQGFVVANRVGAKTFTKIRYEIDCRALRAFLCWVLRVV